jgi:omega-amidase
MAIDDSNMPAHILRTRASENHLFLLFSNMAGGGYSGESSVIGPDGKVLAKADGIDEQVIFAEIDLGAEAYAAKRTRNPLLQWRRPELYGVIGEAEKWEKPSKRPGGF